MSFLKHKKFLIVGLLSDRSIAYGIAQAMHREGATLAFTYQNEKLKDRISDLAKEFNSNIILPCDVSSDEQIQNVVNTIKSEWSTFDGLIHSVAFAPASQLEGDFLDNITREGFNIAHDISSYSLAALAKYAYPVLNTGSSVLALTYLGAERVVPNYNVMGLAKASLEANIRYLANSLGPRGIRVNGISAGPIRTLAASGIKNFRKMLTSHEKIAPMRCNVTIEDVGNTAAFLSSSLAAGITGEIIHVDGGYHITTSADSET